MKKNYIVITVLVVLLLAIAAGFLMYKSNKSQNTQAQTPPKTMEVTPSPTTSATSSATATPSATNKMSMTAGTAPALTEKQMAELKIGTSSATTTKTFDLTAGNFYFVPNKIIVNKGDKVTFVLANSAGFHNIVIDELGVKTAVIKTGETVSATFIAGKVGSFVYYCSLPGHKEKGMWGTITVK